MRELVYLTLAVVVPLAGCVLAAYLSPPDEEEE